MAGLDLAQFFQHLPGKLDPDAADGLDAVYQFDLSGPEGGQYYLIVQDNGCQVAEGTHPNPHVTISMTGRDCLSVLTGQLDGPSVFTSGRLKVSGDLGLAFQLKALFPSVR